MDSFVALAGEKRWRQRLAEVRALAAAGPRAGQAIRQRHVLELSLEKLRRQPDAPMSATEALLEAIAREIPLIAASLTPGGRNRLIEQLELGLAGQNTLVPVFHLIRSAMLQRSRGFTVSFPGLEEGTPHDLLLTRDQIEAEVACDVVSAENGRGVHRGAWFRLADRIDPDLQTWLAAHPGRYLLKMTLPGGLRGGLHDSEPDSEALANLHQRIRAMLETKSRQDHDEAIILRLDPLLLAGAQAEDLGLMSSLRREFGPEAHLSVTTTGGGVFVMAARAGQENEVAIMIRRRLAAIAPVRLTGKRPGILSMFVEDTDRLEWRGLRERLELEGEARQFMTNPEARPVVAVTFTSRLELFGLGEPHAAPGGELRFRNPGHPAARVAALAPAVMSSV
ncbi:hypothetical protein [Rhodopila globiformis]|uniref:Uncharacterized protein n=1 Tax=Rhodopila globiformis TaxID=1071 RepID=A0A2S6N0W3_RHOGL|nr:hypothetical protein [Rhodopila globiformis]PPQ28273.1 hypothetical protein CCS01_24495 [Rhodopila globiformis]